MTSLDRQRVNRHLLRKQHLAPGTDAPLLDLVEELVGLHGTSPTGPYLSLHARLTRFSRIDLDHELYDRRSLVRLKAMRGTVFVFPHRLAAIAHAATRRIFVAADRRHLGPIEADYEALAPVVLRALAGRALSTAELRTAVDTDGDLPAVVGLLADEGLLVRDRPTGSWRSTTFRYRRWDELLPDVDLTAPAEEEALRLLVHRYVAAYGPVTEADVTWWTGLGVRVVGRALNELADELVAVEVAQLPGPSLMTAGDLATLKREAGHDEPCVALLPGLDPLTMGYKERDRYLDPRHRDLVYDRGGNATSTVLVDGVVAGVWDVTDRPPQCVRFLLFDPGLRERRMVLDRATAVGQFYFGESVPVVEYGDMVPLSKRSGVMRKPLDGATPVV